MMMRGRRLCNTSSELMRLVWAVRSCISRLQLTVRAASILVLGRRLVQHRPDTLAAVVAQQHRQQLVAIEPVGLCTPGAPVHFDTRRVDHDVVDALSDQPPVQPPTVAAGLVAAMHPGLGAHTTARSRLGHAVKHRSGIASLDAVPARTATAVADRQLPRPVAELQAHVQLAPVAVSLPCRTVWVVAISVLLRNRSLEIPF
jgi:hypothetical protein